MGTANSSVRTGLLLGTGAAVNISLGWVPKRIDLVNLTDGDILTIGYTDKMIAFTSGGVAAQPAAGAYITGITSGARAKIRDVLLVSGTFAGGDAAGWFIADAEDVTGTFQSENVTFTGSASAADDATVVAQVEHGIKIDTAAASVVTTSGLLAYVGSATTSKGFTIGSVVNESGKLLRWTAFRN